MTNYLHAKIRQSDRALMLETTTGEYVHEKGCGPGMFSAKLYRTDRLSAHKKQMGVVTVRADECGRILERPE